MYGWARFEGQKVVYFDNQLINYSFITHYLVKEWEM